MVFISHISHAVFEFPYKRMICNVEELAVMLLSYIVVHNCVNGFININKEDTNIILGEKYKTLFGRDYITDALAGAKLKITAPSFYQVNHGTSTLIYNEARRLAALNKDDTLLDLYCGAGSIGLSMAEDAKELIGILGPNNVKVF